MKLNKEELELIARALTSYSDTLDVEFEDLSKKEKDAIRASLQESRDVASLFSKLTERPIK